MGIDCFPHTLRIFWKNSRGTKNVYLTNYKNNPDEILSNFKNKKGGLLVKSNKLIERWDYSFHDPKFNEIEKKLKNKE